LIYNTLLEVIHHIQDQGGAVTSFRSLCGGLPAPEAANNPFFYKFSWSPRGVMTAAQNSSTFIEGGESVHVDGKDLLTRARPATMFPTLSLEEIPNRDSTIYREIYGIPAVNHLYRGTFRYRGWCDLFYDFHRMGLMDQTDSPIDLPWHEYLQGKDPSPAAAKALGWLGANELTKRLAGPSVMDAFCSDLTAGLSYGPTERDMVVMHHQFGAVYPDGKIELHESSLMAFGQPSGDTIMAKTVGLTAGIGAELILQGKVQGRGVLLPTTRDIYEPGLGMLEEEGIVFQETMSQVD